MYQNIYVNHNWVEPDPPVETREDEEELEDYTECEWNEED